MANRSINISIPMKIETKCPPRAMTDYDILALTPEQQHLMNDYRNDARRDAYKYLGQHPEITALCSMIFRMTLNQRPRNIPVFLANVFARPEATIRRDVQKIINERPFEYDGIPSSDYEDYDY